MTQVAAREAEADRAAPAWPFHLGLLLALAGLATAELLAAGLLNAPVTAGLWLHAGLLLAFVAAAVFAGGARGELLTALAVLPLIRLLSFSMPLWLTERTNWFALINFPLIVSVIVAARTLGYGRDELGLRFRRPFTQLPILALVLASSVAIGWIERQIIQPEALAESLRLADVWWPALNLLLFTGLSEELLFRGVLQTAAIRALGAWPGILYGAALFGTMHVGWHSFLDVLFVALVGVFFGWVVRRTGTIVAATVAHGVANIMLFLVLPLTGS